jgi:hypothetical protein
MLRGLMASGRDARVTGWTLSIDESGDFAAPDAPVCVAGVLLQEPPTPEADAILRGLLTRVDPLVRYPPHATELRLPAWWVAAWVLAPAEVRAAHPRRRTLDAAAAWCERAAADPALASMWAALRDGRRPAYTTLATASGWMRRRAADVAADLHGLANDVERRYRLASAALVERFGAGGCLLVAASDRGDATHTPTAPDRYLALLDVLFERVFALLRARPPERHVVWVVAATRRVQDAALGDRPLRAQDIGDCVRRAERFPLDAPAGPTDPWVRLLPAMPEAYDERVRPGVVLADFVANRCRGPLASAPWWYALQAQLTDATGLPVEAVPRCTAGAGPMPTVAASGEGRARLAETLAGAPTEPWIERAGGWDLEQAQRWARAVEALRAEEER